MADQNIQMTQRNATNTAWDNQYPKTLASNVSVVDDTTTTKYVLGINNGLLYIKVAV